MSNVALWIGQYTPASADAVSEMQDNGESPSRSDAQLDSKVAELYDIEGLVRSYKSYVLGYASSLLRDRDLAETVTQDCFLRAFNSRAFYRGQCSVRTYLIKIATNLVHDQVRARRFQFWQRATSRTVGLCDIENCMADGKRSAEAHLLARETLARVWNVVAELSERQRTIFVLRFVDEMEISEIATVTGAKVNTVKSCLYRVLYTIRSELGKTDRTGAADRRKSNHSLRSPEDVRTSSRSQADTTSASC